MLPAMKQGPCRQSKNTAMDGDERLAALLQRENDLPTEIKAIINDRTKEFLFDQLKQGPCRQSKNTAMDGDERLAALLQRENDLPTEIKAIINDRTKEFLFDQLITDAANFIHFDVNNSKHTNTEVRTLVECIPESLSCERDVVDHYAGNSDIIPRVKILPIQSALWNYDEEEFNINAITFIPILAEEGSKQNVGGEQMRGGLLCSSGSGGNLIQGLVESSDRIHDNKEKHDLICLDVMKRLWGNDLLIKEDVQKYELLFYSLSSGQVNRFHFLVDLDPAALITWKNENGNRSLLTNWTSPDDPPSYVEYFKLVLAATMKYFPRELGGLLFEREDDGDSACEKAWKKYGSSESWKILEDCLDQCPREFLFERDAEKQIYPFMIVAEGPAPISHLNVIYYLIRKHPHNLVA